MLSMLFLFVFTTTSVNAQLAPRTKVLVAPFDYSSRTADPTFVSMIYDHISFLLGQNSAVQLIGGDSEREKIYKEQDVVKTEPYIKEEQIEQGKLKGAEKLLTGRVYLTQVKREGHDSYSVSFSIYLAVVDMESGTVEDNVMLSPNGIEDSDKMLKILKKLRYIDALPGKRNMLAKMIDLMELADIAVSYNVGGLDQNSSFEEALKQMDKDLIPFLNYHFGGETDGYTPKGGKKPAIKGAGGKNVASKQAYEVAKVLDSKKLLVKSTGLRKGMKLVALELEKLGDGVREVKMADFVVDEMQGDYAVIKLKTRKVDLENIATNDNIVIRISDKQGINPFNK